MSKLSFTRRRIARARRAYNAFRRHPQSRVFDVDTQCDREGNIAVPFREGRRWSRWDQGVQHDVATLFVNGLVRSK